jgi:UDP-perosamine 4-acetyltransferase
MIDVIGIGAGGHARVVIEALHLSGGYRITGLLDIKRELHGQYVAGVPVLGDESQLENLLGQGIGHAFLGVGGWPNSETRVRLYARLVQAGFQIISAIHPRAFVSPSARLGEGLTALPGAVVHANASLGRNVIVNSNALVEHDCVVGDHTHIACSATLAGGVQVGVATHVGIGAVLKEGISIGNGAVVGAGAVVIEDVPGGTVVAGVPARELHRRVA